jgi:dipeptidyl aminopeptidase/acylaminoacyl peptidase
VAAINALRARADIDPDRIFVLGHSLGGYLAPRIAEQDGKLAGMVIMGIVQSALALLPGAAAIPRRDWRRKLKRWRSC